ncbi:hypothetical protein JCM5296_006543 [Sporobolomyces johnsonii]
MATVASPSLSSTLLSAAATFVRSASPTLLSSDRPLPSSLPLQPDPYASALVPLPSRPPPASPSPTQLAQSLVLSRLSTSPTLLPENLARLVTALSLAARVSLRASALFIEAILESLQCSTVASLGVTRRALIAAVGSARAMQYVKGGLDWSGRDEEGRKTDDAFLRELDKYTNLGIYLIHHAFTLAELFTMSSFYLTLNTLQTVSTAAEESVRMLDSILGSNESSRALSSIITLVRNELTQDPRYELAQRGAVASLAALTKAITAFACLQTATHRRTLKELKMRVVYDCTVVVDHEADGGSSGSDSGQYDAPSPDDPGRYAGPHTAAKKRKRLSVRLSSGSLEALAVPPKGEGSEILTDVRSEYEKLAHSRAASEFGGVTPGKGRSRTTSVAPSMCGGGGGGDGGEGELGLGIDLDSDSEGDEGTLRQLEEAEIVHELNELCGVPDTIGSSSSFVGDDGSRAAWQDEGPVDKEELPEEVRIALRVIEEQDLPSGSNGERRVVRPLKGGQRLDAGGYSYEIEIEETTTTTTTTVRTVEELGAARVVAQRTKERVPLAPRQAQQQGGGDGDELMVDAEEEEEEEWVEVSTMFADGLRGRSTSHRSPQKEGQPKSKPRYDGEMEMEVYEDVVQQLPSAANGKQGRGSLAMLSRQETIDHPEESRQRLQVVLSTMTKKFTQRKRTVRRLSPSSQTTSSSSSSPSSPSGFMRRWPGSRSSRLSTDELPISPPSTPPRPPTQPQQQPLQKRKSVLQAFSKPFRHHPAAPTLQPIPQSPAPSPPASSFTVTPRASYATPRATPSPSPASPPPPSSHPQLQQPHRRERTVSASTLAPPSAPQPPADLPSPPPPQQQPPPKSIRRAPSVQTMRSSLMTTCKHTSSSPAEEPEPKASNFPHQHLVSNLQHFARYSSAAYGQSFLRILGIGKHEFKFPHTQIHANNHAFAHHVGIHVDDILLSSFTDPQPNLGNDKMSPIVNYVAVDHSVGAVVLSCRGSLGLSDILVDLTCSYEPMPVPDADPHGSYFVHSGMFCSATTLQRGTVHEVIKGALEQFPTYGLVVCGHSLGGGVAALLSILWSSPAAAFERHATAYATECGRRPSHPPISTAFVTSFSSGLPAGRPISCYTYGVPCVSSPDLGTYCRGLVISTVHNYDIVPTLSLGVLRDLKSMAMGFYAETGVAEEIVGRVIGLCQRRFMAKRTASKAASASASAASSPSFSSSPLPPMNNVHEGDDLAPAALTDPSEESRLVPLTRDEIEAGRGNNKALEPSYKDPSLLGTDMADDVELSDWLWSLRTTIRASSDNEKLYPPGTVYVVENYTVFISSADGTGKYSRREGRRVLLRAVDDVERRFSEPVFSRTMLSDHSPVHYENCVDLLALGAL